MSHQGMSDTAKGVDLTCVMQHTVRNITLIANRSPAHPESWGMRHEAKVTHGKASPSHQSSPVESFLTRYTRPYAPLLMGRISSKSETCVDT
jgi:hypothetical protein